MTKAAPCVHMWMTTRLGLTQSGLDRKGMVDKPSPCRVELTAPYWTLNRNCQTKAVTTTGTMAGKKKIARKNGRPIIEESSKTAIKKADKTPRGVLISTHQRVL